MGCHTRFQREVANIDRVRLVITTPARLDIDLGRAYTSDPRMAPVTDAYNLDLWIKENELEAIIGAKVDQDQLSSAFQYGVRETLGPEGPPFAAVDTAEDVLDLQVVGWGLQVFGWSSPAVFYYKVRVLGWHADGRRFYTANFRCWGDPGPIQWLVSSVSRGTQAAQDLDPAVVQASFDRAANVCGQQFAQRLREHAGNP